MSRTTPRFRFILSYNKCNTQAAAFLRERLSVEKLTDLHLFLRSGSQRGPTGECVRHPEKAVLSPQDEACLSIEIE